MAWAVLALFVAGSFYAPVGVWTGAVLGAWFVGTQRPLRGFLTLTALNCVFSIPGHWRIVFAGSAQGVVAELRWLIVGATAAAVPFLLYRITLRRLPAFASVTMLAAASGAVNFFAPRLFPVRFSHSSMEALAAGWLGAAVMVLWRREFGDWRRTASHLLVPVLGFATAMTLLPLDSHAISRQIPDFTWLCVAMAGGLALWAAFTPGRYGKRWSEREEMLRILRSPVSRERLHVEQDDGGEVLASASGERFRIHDGIAEVVRAEDLTGLNGRYNRLYETIGGMYDDVQRVACALGGLDREKYMRSYLDPLEVKAGDAVLETSIGTGLNLQYLPHGGVHFVGLDLSRAMLAACRLNLERWGLEADLLLGNAEYLPFADESFDVVFHVGGINFFSDRKRAIHEMIRVAKPGSRILIADETEEHVKEMYERGPITSGYFKNRAEAVTAPVDLIPREMEEVELKTLAPVGKNRFYVLTFRKPEQGKIGSPEGSWTCVTSRMDAAF